MKVSRWLCLGALVVYALCTASCTSCESDFGTGHFHWRGKVWSIVYNKDVGASPVGVRTPDGKYVYPDDPKLPFIFKDGGMEPKLKRSALNSGRGADSAPPYYLYVLSDVPNDAVYIFDQDTARLVSTVSLPTLPIGLAVSNDGQRVYVGNQEIPAGNPFFVQAPPRISVIDKSTRAIIQTINLPSGKRPGKPVLSLDDRLLYVPNQGTFVSPVGFQGASVMIIDSQSRAMVGEIPLNVPGAAINRLVMTPDGALIYAVQTQSSPARLFVIDTLSREVAAMVVVNVAPTDLTC